MSLHVKPKGNQWSASWLYDFRIAGKPDTTSLGQYPEVPLKEARERLVDARRLVFEKRINPADQRRADRRAAIDAANAKSLADANTFKFVAEEWLGRQKGEEKTKQARNSRVAKLYPEIGHRPISEIGSSELLRAIRKIEAEGKLHTVKRIRNLCNSIWDYAILEGKATFNIAGPLQRAFNTKSTEHLAALTDPKAVGKLMLAIDGYSSPLTKAGLKLLALTFARPGEVRKMTWSQIDFDKAIWTVPIGNMKMRRIHEVPLSKQAIKILSTLRRASEGDGYVFPSQQSEKMLSENTFNKALNSLGYDGATHTSHGFRSTGATLMREHKNSEPYVIELALSHKVAGIEGIYQRITLLDKRRKMLQEYADYLDELKAEAGSV